MKFAVIKTGGKQYIVRKDEEIVVDKIDGESGSSVEFDMLAEGDDEKNEIKLGKPILEKRAKGKIVENLKGDKIRIARFKAKTRYRKVTGFRPMLSKVKILSI